MRVLRAWWKVRRLPGYTMGARVAFCGDLVRDCTSHRVRARWGQGDGARGGNAGLGVERDCTRIFLHTPASVTRYAAIMRGLPWSGSGHGEEIWTSLEWELRRPSSPTPTG